MLTPEELKRYSRHILLEQVGLEGQKRLKASSVLIVGVGGLGTPVAQYLAAAGIGRIGVMDDDRVDLTNLQRQVIYSTEDVGREKVIAARERLIKLNTTIHIEAYTTRATPESLRDVVRSYEVVVDGTDNFLTRYAINDACIESSKPFVYSSISQFEGQASVFGTADSPCYRCLFPEPPPSHLVPSCAEGGVLGVLPGLLGTVQATEVLKLLLGLGQSLAGRLLLIDALAMRFRELSIEKDPNCPTCGTSTSVRTTVSMGGYCTHVDVPSITPAELHRRLQAEDFTLLDVRTAQERADDSLGGLYIPNAQLAARLDELSAVRTSTVVVYCQTGVRSRQAAALLLEAGFESVYSLDGGLKDWRATVGETAHAAL